MTSTNNVVSTYSLSNMGTNIWTHVAMVLDQTTSNIMVYQDGLLVDTISNVDLNIPNTSNPISIGFDDTAYFEGNMDDFRIYNRIMTSNDITNIYNTKLSDKMLINYDFEHYNIERGEIYDQSIHMNTGTMQNMNANLFDNDDKIISATSFNTSTAVTEYFKITNNSTMFGSNLNNCTFSAWVKTSELNSFEPIISRDGVFSFGLNFGHASLRLGDGNSFSLLPSVQASGLDQQTASSSSSSSAPTIDLTTNLIKDVTFDKDISGVTHHNDAKLELNDVYDGSMALALQDTSNQYVEIDGSANGSTDLSSFSFSGWVKFNNVPSTGEIPIFKRGDDELKFGLSNGALVLNMMANVPDAEVTLPSTTTFVYQKILDGMQTSRVYRITLKTNKDSSGDVNSRFILSLDSADSTSNAMIQINIKNASDGDTNTIQVNPNYGIGITQSEYHKINYPATDSHPNVYSEDDTTFTVYRILEFYDRTDFRNVRISLCDSSFKNIYNYIDFSHNITNADKFFLDSYTYSSETINTQVTIESQTAIFNMKKTFNFNESSNLEGLSLKNSQTTIPYITEDGISLNTGQYYTIPFDLRGNTSDFIIDFEYKASSQRTYIFQFESMSNHIIMNYKVEGSSAPENYWRLNTTSADLKMMTSPADLTTTTRFTYWYKYNENRFYVYVNGVAEVLHWEARSSDKHNENSFITGLDSNTFNSSMYKISFGHIPFTEVQSAITFKHFYYDIGGVYTPEMIAIGFVV